MQRNDALKSFQVVKNLLFPNLNKIFLNIFFQTCKLLELAHQGWLKEAVHKLYQQGGEGVKQIMTLADKGGRGIRHMMTAWTEMH